MAIAPARRILLTGATGYIGGRLLPRLEQRGENVRCLTRRPEALRGQVGPKTEVVAGDALDPADVERAMAGIDTAYYLVHSIGADRDFEVEDRAAATLFARAAAAACVRRMIYLGGLGNRDQQLSKHLRSRQETGDLLRASGASVIEFRASIVIGSGSLSFELIRALVERLPIMICPKWVQVLAQPIGIEDVLAYLIAAIDLPHPGSQVYEIGGPDQISYGGIMREYARQRKLRRWMIPVPVLTPYLSSLWLGLITPVYARIGRKLIESLKNPTVVSNNLAEQTFAIRPLGIAEAIQRALRCEDQDFAATRWSDAISSAGRPRRWGGARFGSRLVDSRRIEVAAPSAAAFAAIERIGGDTGWYGWDWLWRVRGFCDLLVGGVGSRRGRRDPLHVRTGDTVDFWRVREIEPGQRLTLEAEMRLPGRAWLEFDVRGDEQRSEIRQTAVFDPRGLLGIAYWYSMAPFHQLIFGRMLRGIAAAARTPGLRRSTSLATDRRNWPTRSGRREQREDPPVAHAARSG